MTYKANTNITMYELVRTQLYLNMVQGVVFTINTTGMTHLKSIKQRSLSVLRSVQNTQHNVNTI